MKIAEVLILIQSYKIFGVVITTWLQYSLQSQLLL